METYPTGHGTAREKVDRFKAVNVEYRAVPFFFRVSKDLFTCEAIIRKQARIVLLAKQSISNSLKPIYS